MSPIGTKRTSRDVRSLVAIGGKADMAVTSADFRVCEGFRMPARDDGATDSGGRRPQTSKGGNRGTSGTAERQTLWRFRRWRSVAEVR
jgi:hypothetical protein